MKKVALAVFGTLLLAGSIFPLSTVLRDGDPYPLCPPKQPNCTGVVQAPNTGGIA